MKQLLFIFCGFIFFNSCDKDKNENVLSLSVYNTSDTEVTNIKIYANIGVTNNNFVDSVTIDNIEINKQHDTEWVLKNLPSVDGDFVLKCQRNDENFNKEFGYFTNGSLLDKSYVIHIENDTVKISK